MLDDTSKLQLLEKKLKTIKGVKLVPRYYIGHVFHSLSLPLNLGQLQPPHGLFVQIVIEEGQALGLIRHFFYRQCPASQSFLYVFLFRLE